MNKLDMRILQIDLARQKETVEYVKKYADLAKECGYNYLQLYLENVIRTPDTEFFDKEDTYSLDEMKEIVSYAESIGLKVIPCFENLPHLEKFFQYKELEHLSELYDEKTPTRKYFSYIYGTCGCPSNPELYKFMDKYLTDCMQAFPNSEYVHMCLDEVFDLAHCDRCRERLNNGETKKDIFYKHFMHTYNLIKSWGKKLISADDFFEYVDITELLPRDVIVFNWNYGFIGSELSGHWIGKRKKDWFRKYDELGIKYIFAVYSHRGSSVYNTDTFTHHANKYSPYGACATAWCRSESFYQGAYPFMYYSGKLWSGEIQNEQDRIDKFAYMLQGDKELAELLLSQTIGGCGGGLGVFDNVEDDLGSNYNFLIRTKPFIEKLRSYLPKMQGRAKEILTDIYDYAYEGYLNATLVQLGKKVFDSYESDGITDKYIAQLEEYEKGIAEIKANAKWLWSIDRSSIKSQHNNFENKYSNYEKRIAQAKEHLKQNKKWGVLTCEYMLADIYGTPQSSITVNYADGESKVICSGQVKPSIGGALFQIRRRIENKLIDSITFTAWGEGATYPTYFYYVVDGKKYIVDSVEKIEGSCQRIEKLLENDSGFAILGYEDAMKCFNDIDATKEKHTIKIKFKKL